MIAQKTEAARPDVVRLVDELLVRGIASGASDVHFEPVDEGLLIRVRIDGQLVDWDVFEIGLSENIVSRLKVMASLLTYRVDIPQEGGFWWKRDSQSAGDHRTELRVATFPTIRGERAVVRVFRGDPQLHSLDSLGMTVEQLTRIRDALARPAGFIVVSGPAGSGKTTTLYAMIRDIRDRFPGRSVITLEDPVEQRLNRVAQIQINPHGELSYERCMRSLLRHDPQVILLGEVRDRQTASAAVEAALTGHLILTTVHSSDPAETIIRFLEMGIPPYQLASALTMVCSQRLLRRRCRRCRTSSRKGCEDCIHTGYAGQIAIAQVAELDEGIRTFVLAHSSASSLRTVLRGRSSDLRDEASAAVELGITDDDEVVRVLGRGASTGTKRPAIEIARKPNGPI